MGTIAELIARQGDIAARGAERSGEIWGNAVQNVGQIAGQAVGQYQQKKEESKRDQALTQFISSGVWQRDPGAAVTEATRILGPRDGPRLAESLLGAVKLMQPASADPGQARQSLEMIARGWDLTPKTMRPALWASVHDLAGKAGIKLPAAEYTPELDPMIAQFGGQKGEAGFSLSPGQVRYDASGKQIASAAPAPPKAPDPGSFQEYMSASPERRKEIEAARKGYMQADDRPINIHGMGGDMGDPKVIAQGIIDGDLPPVLSNYGRYVQGATATELKKKGYNLAGAVTDWAATQKHIASLNGAQQTRLRQAVDTAYHSLDVIDELAGKWKGGRFPILNKANLIAAQNGAYGKEAAAVATALQAQITDLTSELGNVYMGGNSPTDHALKLAGKNLSAEWDENVLKKMTDLARTNLKIRSNSMVNVGVAGASANNPYAPEAPSTPAAARPTATNPKTGEKIEWDGTNWVPVGKR